MLRARWSAGAGAAFSGGGSGSSGEDGGKAALVPAKPDGYEITGNLQVEGDGPSWAHPVVAGGRLYLRYADNLYCFDVRAK